MDKKSYLISILTDFANKKENCFDEYLAARQNELHLLRESQLSALIESRKKCEKASKYLTFTREDLRCALIDETLDPKGLFAQVFDSFDMADSFFERL